MPGITILIKGTVKLRAVDGDAIYIVQKSESYIVGEEGSKLIIEAGA